MGVQKLWDLLLTVAMQKRIEDLSGLVLAIDASIWIVKINSIYENVDEGLKCIFNKLVWLKKNNIKPIFVFDGDTPILKRRTLEDRRNRRKELNNFDITKKVEIEIVKAVTGVQSTQKNEQVVAFQEKSKEIDLMLANLFKYENAATTIELSQKMALQAEVLNKKYELYCQMHPTLANKFGSLNEFTNLDIETKQQILEQVKESGILSTKDFRKFKDQMSEQQKIMYEMQVIKKKSQIRQLQDNLYRKLMTKKIENGFEIIEGVYNGKKVVQKRKIKEKPLNDWVLGRTKKDTCNDFKQIFRKNKDVSQAQKSAHEDDTDNNFFAKIFNKDYNVDKRNSENSLSQMSSRLSQLKSNNLPQQNETNESAETRNRVEVGYEDENYYDVEQRRQAKPKEKQGQDPDNFPDFIMVQNLDELCTSSHNLHLQNMLDILGINYIVAPFEAEAQCAALEQMGLVDGVVTEDSDVFLFGARAVYRGLFQDNVKLYLMKKIEEKLLLTREKLILFGLMLGSDYTDGVKGIGIVNAMEILKVHHDIESLKTFTDWARNADVLQQNDEYKTEYMVQSALSEDEVHFYKLHRKFKNYWHIHPSFPQHDIYEAYLHPAIQEGRELEKKVSSNKKIEVEPLRKLMEQKFKMVPLQIDMNMKILTKQFDRRRQTEITEFMRGDFARIASKRLQKAIDFRHDSN